MTEPQKIPVILVIDDDDVNRQVVNIVLKREGFKPVLAEDGKTGIALARTESPDLILLDIFMPDEDGFEILKNLKQEPGVKAIPVVIFTILEKEESRKKALDLGASDYITKPFDMKEIVVHIRKILELEK
jgi:DNA-binding response OmpR family regulator